jgi:hypothetical protein
MKTFFRTLACLGVLGLMACQQFEIDTQMTPEKAAASIRMECSAVDTYTLPSTNPESFTFNVSSNTPWTITLSSGADWLTVTPASSSAGSLIADVTVTAQANTGDDRQATLTLKGDNISETKLITVKQTRKGRLFITPVSKDFDAAGGSLDFTIQTNMDWEVHCNQSWISFDRESGEPDPEGNSMTIVATAKPSDVMERTATITVISGENEESFDIFQTGTFVLTEISTPFASDGESKNITLKTDLPWEVMADKDWITFDQTSGTGEGTPITIVATAAANEGQVRKANVTVSAGGVDKTFEVSQDGFNFDIVTPESTELPAAGGEMILEVKASAEWTPFTEVAGWSVEKIDATSFKVIADFNNRFIAKSGMVAIKSAKATAELELSQGVNFEFTDAEVQADGSVKIFGDKKSRVTLKEGARYVSFVLEIGEKNFDDAGQFWLCTHDAAGDSELQCQITLNGNKRLRTNGAHTNYGSTKFSITKEEMNAITEYRMDFRPVSGDPSQIEMEFFYNGTSKVVHKSASPYASSPDAVGHYFFGTESGAAGSGTWYIVKSCTPTFIAE